MKVLKRMVTDVFSDWDGLYEAWSLGWTYASLMRSPLICPYTVWDIQSVFSGMKNAKPLAWEVQTKTLARVLKFKIKEDLRSLFIQASWNKWWCDKDKCPKSVMCKVSLYGKVKCWWKKKFIVLMHCSAILTFMQN